MNVGASERAFLAAVSVAISATLVLTVAVLRAARSILSFDTPNAVGTAQVVRSTDASGDVIDLRTGIQDLSTADASDDTAITKDVQSLEYDLMKLETQSSDPSTSHTSASEGGSSGGSYTEYPTKTISPTPTYEYETTVVPRAAHDESPAVVEVLKSTATEVQYIDSQKAVSEGVITQEIHSGVQDSLNEARKSVIDAGTLEDIRRELMSREAEVVNDVSQKIQYSVPTTASQNLDPVNQSASETLTDIENIIKEKASVEIDFDNRKERIASEVERLESVLEQQSKLLSREGLLMYRDDDSDAVSNYDEIYIYGTNPSDADTAETGSTDGERILQGLDPRTASPEPIRYDDPNVYGEVVNQLYRVTDIAIVPKDVSPQGAITSRKTVFRGKALPNSYVTLYVYSTPIIVTVKTDLAGEWVYELDYELEDGEHVLYMATVNNSGRILAKSSGIGFTKEAEAVTLLAAEDLEPTATRRTFFSGEFIPTAIGIASAGLLIAVLALGYVSRRDESKQNRERQRTS